MKAKEFGVVIQGELLLTVDGKQYHVCEGGSPNQISHKSGQIPVQSTMVAGRLLYRKGLE